MFKLSMTHQLCRAVRACFREVPICDMLTHSLSTCGIECCARASSDSGHDGGTLRHTRVPMELGQESRWSQDRSHSEVRTGVTVKSRQESRSSHGGVTQESRCPSEERQEACGSVDGVTMAIRSWETVSHSSLAQAEQKSRVTAGNYSLIIMNRNIEHRKKIKLFILCYYNPPHSVQWGVRVLLVIDTDNSARVTNRYNNRNSGEMTRLDTEWQLPHIPAPSLESGHHSALNHEVPQLIPTAQTAQLRSTKSAQCEAHK